MHIFTAINLLNIKNKIKMMKNLKLFVLFFMTAGLFVACGNSEATTEESTEDTATETTTELAGDADPIAAAKKDDVPTGPTTTIEFPESTFDFGEIKEGEKVRHGYAFTNTGSEPLVISNAKGSCGCTVPDWPRDPIAPGASSVIKVQFDSRGKGKVGGNPQSKRVTITANTDPANSYLTIKGTVDKEEAAPTS